MPHAFSLDFTCLLNIFKQKTHKVSQNTFKRVLKSSDSERFKSDLLLSKKIYHDELAKNPSFLNFKINLERLLNELPPEDAHKVKRLLQTDYIFSKKTRNGYFSGGDAFYDVNLRSIRVELPAYYQGTEVENILKFHETIHMLNHIRRDSTISKIAKLKLETYQDNFLHIKFEEFGAMSAEWQYLQSIPPKVRAEIISTLEIDVFLNHNYKNFLLNVFKDKSIDPVQYINKWRDFGRYNDQELTIVANAHWQRKRLEARVKIGSAMALTGFTIGSVKLICSQFKNSSPSLRSYCQGLLNFR